MLPDPVWNYKGGLTMKKPKQDSLYHENIYHENDDFYTEEEIETLLEDDEISVTEEAFMRGYIDA